MAKGKPKWKRTVLAKFISTPKGSAVVRRFTKQPKKQK